MRKTSTHKHIPIIRILFHGFLGIFFLFTGTQVSAKIKLSASIGSNMVLQRDIPIAIWGQADKRERITIFFHGDTVKVRADKKGTWTATLGTYAAGGPFEMRLAGKDTLTLHNILVGDIWICSGQSNMEFQLRDARNSQKEIEAAQYPRMRLLTVEKKVSTTPLNDCGTSGWQVCTPESVPSFSAVAYFFGRKLIDDLDVPIGLVHTSWGGTNVETWTSAEAISKVAGFEDTKSELEKFNEEELEDQIKTALEEKTGPLPVSDSGMVKGKAIWARPNTDFSRWQTMDIPQLWEGAGLKNLDGIVWFEREFVLDEQDLQKQISIHLGPIDDSDITFLNGEKIGETNQRYNEPRIYHPNKKLLHAGTNVLVVRVEDTGGGGGIYGNPDDIFVQLPDEKISLAGEWRYKLGKASLATAVGPNSMPSLLYNAMIHPLLPMRIKGAIWYQGESNAGRAYQYRTLFPTMIKDWRSRWQQGDFPFLFVQLANFMDATTEPGESTWAELREAQSMTLTLPKTGMATTIDIGAAKNIHPKNKQDVGRRLALCALKEAYGKDVVASGPNFSIMEIKHDRVILHYNNVGSGLYLKNKYGYVNGFAIAGADRHFYWAKAEISGNTVVVRSDQVKEPVAVRYGWANNPDDLNLYNLEGLPAVPFRTDDWPGITKSK